MNPLQYTSEEMVSSTELIRKSKKIFDKLHNKDIEKAIILRDGKPAFMLLEFSEYEKLMKEYLNLKENPQKKKEKTKVNEIKKETKVEELNEDDLREALEEIEKLDLDNLDSLIEEENIKEKEPLKDFWE